MATPSIQSRRISKQHRAFSTFEITTIVAALSVGVGVGLAVMQFGLLGGDSLNYQPLEDVTVSSNEVFSSTVSSKPDANDIQDLKQQLKQQLMAEIREELAAEAQTNALQTIAARSRASSQRQQMAIQQAAANRAAQHQAIGQKTLQYWNGLNAVMEREEKMRSAPMGGLTARNVRSFLGRRGKANAYAAEAIRRLPTARVDPAVVGQAAAIAAWYQQGSQVNGTANQLVKRGNEADRRGMAGENWKQAERQHNQSVAELNSRGDALRQQMSQEYNLPFPDLR